MRIPKIFGHLVSKSMVDVTSDIIVIIFIIATIWNASRAAGQQNFVAAMNKHPPVSTTAMTNNGKQFLTNGMVEIHIVFESWESPDHWNETKSQCHPYYYPRLLQRTNNRVIHKLTVHRKGNRLSYR